MCGIGGVIKLGNSSVNLTDAAQIISKTLRHRGPDDEGFLFFSADKNVCAFGNDTAPSSKNNPFNFSATKPITEVENNFTGVFTHRRLSIIDVTESGHQPMCTTNSKVWITFNGEIYNYIELRDELKKLGYSFITQSDTEVLLNAYAHWGYDCLQKLNGMFSFTIYDAEKQKIFCARDRSGVKPFYYYHKNGLFCFASEIKALRALPFLETQLNERALQHYLLYDALEYEEESLLKNIFELFPSHYLEIDLKQGSLSKKKYFDLKTNNEFLLFNEQEFSFKKQEAEQFISDAIVKRLRADVSVGCCLSGGIDSSVISGVISKHNQNFNAFTATFPDEAIDESKHAKDVVNFTHAKWHTTTPTAEELNTDFDKFIYALDIPIWSTSTYAQYRVMQLAKQNNVKVVLDGQGADELFGGYSHYYTTYVNELLKNKHFRQASSEIKSFGNKFWYIYTKENAKRQLHYNANKKLLNADFVKAHNSPLSWETKFNSLNENLEYDFYNHRLKTYLRCEDRCSMYHSVESRTPFADDTNLINFAFNTPASYKIHNGTSKFILRESMKNYLPDSIYNRKDKLGFVTPHNQWLSTLIEKKQDLLNSSKIKPFFSDRFFVKTDQFFAKTNQKKKLTLEKENTLAFKSLVFSIWLNLMKI